MAVGFRSSSQSGTSDTNGTSCVIPVPSGAASGDIALLAMEHWETYDATGITWPSGFTQIVSALTGSREKLYVAWKRLTAADTGNYTVTWTSTQWNMGHCILITGGLASGDPIEATNTNTATGTALPSVSVTTATNAFLAHFVANENAATGSPPTTPAFTETRDGDYLKSNYHIPGTTGTFTTSGGSTSASTAKVAALVAVKPAAGGGSSTAANTATETDATFSLGKAKSRASATSTETDTSITLARLKSRASTLAAETDAAIAIGEVKSRAVGLAASTELALPIGRLKTRATGLNLETDTSQTLGRSKVKAIGLSAESDSAFAFGSVSGISLAIGTALETDTAFAVGYTRAKPIWAAVETDTAILIDFASVAWRLVLTTITEPRRVKGSMIVPLYREVTIFGDEDGLFASNDGYIAEGADDYGAIPFGTKYIWYGGHQNITTDPAIRDLWLAHSDLGISVEVVSVV